MSHAELLPAEGYDLAPQTFAPIRGLTEPVNVEHMTRKLAFCAIDQDPPRRALIVSGDDMRIVTALIALMICTPVLGAPVSIVVQNTSQDTIESISVFPVGVADSVGNYSVPIAPGQAGRIDLSLEQCRPVEVLVTIKGNAAEFRPVVDLCRDPLLTVGE